MAAGLISPSKVRRYLLDTAKATRHHPFARVSQDTISKIEGIVRRACVEHVKAAPSKGKTL